MSDTLIVLYSRSGNTRKIGESIRNATGAVLTELEPVTAYTRSYDAVVKQAKKEIQSGFLPPLRKAPDPSPYGTIFLGSPNWWSTIAPPVAAFLSQANLTGKTVIPFLTHGGGGSGRMEKDITRLCPDSVVRPALVVPGDGGPTAGDLVVNWLSGLAKLSP